MKKVSLLISVFLFCTQIYAGAPLLNCAVPVGMTAQGKAELGLKFQFNFDLCFKYYMTRGTCDARCVPTFTDLCRDITSGCASIPVPSLTPEQR